MQKIRSEKGITIIALVVTMIIILLISIPLVVNTVNLSDVNELTKHREDFYNLSETISQVYNQESSIADIGPTYVGSTSNCNNPNDGDTYYAINVSKLVEDLNNKYGTTMKHLNFGEKNYNISGNTSNEIGDIYIINGKSRTIYYIQGFENSKGQILYTYPENYTNIVLENYVTN